MIPPGHVRVQLHQPGRVFLADVVANTVTVQGVTVHPYGPLETVDVMVEEPMSSSNPSVAAAWHVVQQRHLLAVLPETDVAALLLAGAELRVLAPGEAPVTNETVDRVIGVDYAVGPDRTVVLSYSVGARVTTVVDAD
jgi:hypothetical protein